MTRFDILTLFPNIFDSYFQTSILGRAQQKKLIRIYTHNIRDHAKDRYGTVDDKPYGGGVGMVMKIEPIFDTLKKVPVVDTRYSAEQLRLKNIHLPSRKTRIILFSPSGKRLTQHRLRSLSCYKQLIMICGRYEGVDHRVHKLVHETISIGDYVLTGGEIPAMILIDGITRLIPGALGKDQSSQNESFSESGYLEHPHFTRPPIFSPDGKKHWSVPRVLLRGNHALISDWRKHHSSTEP